jgi:excisionase family DNA binding protein
MHWRMSEVTHMNRKMLTVQEFANAVGWSPSTVRQKIWHRELEYVKLGRSVRFKPETVQRLIEQGTVPALEGGRSTAPNRESREPVVV